MIDVIEPWIGESSSVVLSGMITSRRGWIETPYVPCPASLGDLASELVSHRGRDTRLDLWFVPGVSRRGSDDLIDVMRGEETQLAGELDRDEGGAQLFVLPGTHSKWALVDDGSLAWFATFMTGELYDLLTTASILADEMSEPIFDDSSFCAGVDAGLSGGLLHRLFGVRTKALFGEMSSAHLACYASGVLIGSEIRDATDQLPDRVLPNDITVIGSPDLASRYIDALGFAGVAATAAAANAAARGHFRLAQQRGLAIA